MTRKQDIAKGSDWKEIWKTGPEGGVQPDWLRGLVAEVVQQVLEGEMDDTLRAEKGERTPERLGYRSGYYTRTLVTRVGKLTLRVPQDRNGRFRTEVFERYQRSEKALVVALTEMYVQGVSTRKVKPSRRPPTIISSRARTARTSPSGQNANIAGIFSAT